MIALDIAEVLPRFPAFRVALVAARDLTIAAARPQALAEAVAAAETALLAAHGATPSGEIPGIRAWRQAYRGFGVKKTSYRSSVERLVRSIQKGRGLPAVNALVDAYNAVSVRHVVPVGADDIDRITGPLAFRFARPGDSFTALGDESGADDPPKDGEVVYADAEKVLCRRWNWYQDARSAVTPATRRAVLTVQTLAPAPAAEEAAETLAASLAVHCAARVDWAVADSSQPVVALPDD